MKMGDYLGEILSEITRARVQADLEALRVAELYAGHPLLKNFSIPRIRLPKVDIDIPVIISESPEEGEQFEKKRMDKKSLAKETKQVINEELRSRDIKLDSRNNFALNRSLLKKSESLGVMREFPTTDVLSREMATVSVKTLEKEESAKKSLTKNNLDSLSSVLEGRLKERLARQVPSPGIKIQPHTAAIKEIKENEKLVTMRLSIQEDAMEWTNYEDENGKESSVLVPE
jgi:hypothetical protein